MRRHPENDCGHRGESQDAAATRSRLTFVTLAESSAGVANRQDDVGDNLGQPAQRGPAANRLRSAIAFIATFGSAPGPQCQAMREDARSGHSPAEAQLWARARHQLRMGGFIAEHATESLEETLWFDLAGATRVMEDQTEYFVQLSCPRCPCPHQTKGRQALAIAGPLRIDLVFAREPLAQ